MRTLLLAAAIGALAGCATPGETPSGPPVVVVSVLPQAFFVERLAGDAVEIEVMIPPGASPHTHEPDVRQMKALSRASLYLSIGHPHFPFENEWIDRLGGASGPRVVPMGRGVPCPDEEDPHVWVAPGAARVLARNAAAALADLLPHERGAIGERLVALEDEIGRVDAEVSATLAGRRSAAFLVFHPSWGCFAAEYGLEQLAIEDEGKEPTAGLLARLVERARADGVRAVLVQPQLSRESADVIASEIGAEVRIVDPLARDWPEMMRALARALAS
jgi:zinc transport system substrate-binding protein